MKKKMKFRSNGGFTLVELMVSILCTTLIMGAVLTWLLVGIRIEGAAANNMERQQKTRIVLTLMESMAAQGKVSIVQNTGVAAVVDEEELQSGSAGTDWVLLDESNNALVRYRAGSGTIVTGNGDVLMEDLEYAEASFDIDKKVLQLSLKADGQVYSTDIFCRTQITPTSYGTAELLELVRQKEATSLTRIEFLSLLTSQAGSSGEIIDNDEINGGKYEHTYFTECYLQNVAQVEGKTVDNWSEYGSGFGQNWSPKTPWCATYVSWALVHMNHSCYDDDYSGDNARLEFVPLFANVNDGRDLFDRDYDLEENSGGGERILGKNRPSQKVGKWIDSSDVQGNSEFITPGDLIFFDWGEVGTESGVSADKESAEESVSGEESLDHVGVVLYIEEGQVFTIEGNTDGKVSVRNYEIADPAIVGYGVLDWKTN